MFGKRNVLRLAGVLALVAGGAAANPLGIPDIEYDALVALYNSTDGPNWQNNTNWLTGNVSWYGVTVSSGHVTMIDLGGNQLSGDIPPDLGNLQNLTELYLWGNQLSGIIPPELGNLANLWGLDLTSNQLTGSIPPELGDLANLWALNLGSNQLKESIPPELGNLANLWRLDLADNQLTGSIPPELGNLQNLTQLYLHYNQLTGSIPPELGNLANLWHLMLGQNQLMGSIPPELGNLTELQRLNLESNQLTGSIPVELGSLVKLQQRYGLNLCYNALFTPDPAIGAFLEAKSSYSGDWRVTQTVAPADITVEPQAGNSAALSWTPILYTTDSGYYEAGIGPSAEGLFTFDAANRTADKSATGLTINGLPEGTNYLVVRTVTLPHANNQNTVVSLPSAALGVWVGDVEDAASIGAAKLLEDGAGVRLQDVVVTAATGQTGPLCYVEEPDISCGIAVETASGAAVGDRADVSGVMGTTADGERMITQATVSVDGPVDSLPPVPMTLEALAGGAWFFEPSTGCGQRGVTDPPGRGLSTTGLLVDVTGRVQDMDPDFICINDGSWYGTTGIRVSRAHVPVEVGLGSCVRVWGISSIRKLDSAYQLVLKPRSVEDVEVVYQP